MLPPSPAAEAAVIGSLQRAGALFRARRYLEAAEAYREVIRLKPKLADVHNNLGVSLKAAGHVADAIPCFRRAVRLKPDYLSAHANLASALEATGDLRAALEHRIDAWRLEPDAYEPRDALIRTLRRCPYDKAHPGARTALAALQANFDIDQQGLSDPAIRLWSSHPAIRRGIDNAYHGFPERPAASGFKPISDFLADDVIIGALCWSIIAHPGMEAWLTRSRRWVLDHAVEGDLGRIDPTWLAAIALQARASEWVWFETEEERDQLIRLAELQAEGVETRHRDLVRALYLPMETDPDIDILSREVGAQSPDDLSPRALLLRRSLVHSREEWHLAEEVSSTEVRDEVSRAVQSQYEDNPYPRWLTISRRPRTTIRRHMAQVLALPQPPRAEETLPRILIAGCGTGRHALQTALRYENAEVLAIDLSRASLAYARRMARELRVRNIRFAQADILEMGIFPERFDLIESSGVLHHLEDPMRGWRVLRRLLAPRGLMRLAFYSRRARLPLDDVRRDVPDRGDMMKRVRTARRRTYGLPDGHAAKALLRSADFYAASGVRDALLHTQEHTVDPLWIRQALKELGLRFLGFELPDPAILEEYRRRYPNDPSALNLEAWDAMEADHPDIFLGMYQFWVQADG
ncbi:MAG: methyltransferase domain-containing protein [Thalassobaculaceae bacterium]|nr:methyltransferase domain-containing protein [Thalassobaculaceae bacterium]